MKIDDIFRIRSLNTYGKRIRRMERESNETTSRCRRGWSAKNAGINAETQ